MKNKKTFLDFGCGPGTFIYLLSKKYSKINFTGIESLRTAVINGNKKYKRKNLELKNARKISGNYDAISAIKVLHEIKTTTPEKMLKDFYKHLNSKGLLFIKEFYKTSKKHFREYIKDWNSKEDFNAQYAEHNKWSIKQFEMMCKKTGFRTLKIKKGAQNLFYYVGIKEN